MSFPMRTIPGYFNDRQGIQVGTKLEGEVTMDSSGKLHFDEEGIRFLLQMGVSWVMVGSNQVPRHDAETYKKLKEELLKRGLKIYRLANDSLHNMPEVTLNLEGREAKIERYLKYIRDLGEAGIHYATYAHMGNGIWRTDIRKEVRGGATAGGLDFDLPNRSMYFGDFHWPLSHGREFSEEELWDNYEYFIRRAAPVAEDSGVYIGIHPDDPPVYTIAGVPRCIFGNFDGYKRALEIADSPNIGVCLCVGCWLEGGERMGCDPVSFIEYLAEHKKLFKIHLRNVTAPLYEQGGFNETFPDAGYYDLGKVIEVLDKVGFDGCIMNDHLIDMVGGHYTCEAFFTSYLKGLVDGIQRK